MPPPTNGATVEAEEREAWGEGGGTLWLGPVRQRQGGAARHWQGCGACVRVERKRRCR